MAASRTCLILRPGPHPTKTGHFHQCYTYIRTPNTRTQPADTVITQLTVTHNLTRHLHDDTDVAPTRVVRPAWCAGKSLLTAAARMRATRQVVAGCKDRWTGLVENAFTFTAAATEMYWNASANSVDTRRRLPVATCKRQVFINAPWSSHAVQLGSVWPSLAWPGGLGASGGRRQTAGGDPIVSSRVQWKCKPVVRLLYEFAMRRQLLRFVVSEKHTGTTTTTISTTTTSGVTPTIITTGRVIAFLLDHWVIWSRSRVDGSAFHNCHEKV